MQINRRYGALSAEERVRIKLYVRTAVVPLVHPEEAQADEEEKEDIRAHAALLLALVCQIRKDRTVLPRSVRRVASVS